MDQKEKMKGNNSDNVVRVGYVFGVVGLVSKSHVGDGDDDVCVFVFQTLVDNEGWCPCALLMDEKKMEKLKEKIGVFCALSRGGCGWLGVIAQSPF